MTQLTHNTPSPIAQLGDPVLRKPADVIQNIRSNETQSLIQTLMDTVAQAGGVGIAAPQINISKRIFIMCSKPNKRYPSAPLMEPTAIINPEIISTSKEQEKDWEGCLSVPSIRGLVPRYKTIQVSYFDLHAKQHNKELNGFLARIFQHEIDHLNGLTFIDRVESVKDLYSESEWYKQFVN